MELVIVATLLALLASISYVAGRLISRRTNGVVGIVAGVLVLLLSTSLLVGAVSYLIPIAITR